MPVLANAAEQTTIIYLDPNTDYKIGQKVKVTVGISSTDGSYLESATGGFGYNGSTMKLLTKTDDPQSFSIKADSPQKRLYKDFEFEMTNNGKMFFIAGAYNGDGVIQGIKADGSPQKLPRASVVRKVGTGIYSKSSDCNLQSILFSNGEKKYEPTREFNPLITEYWIRVDEETDKLDASAVTEVPTDKVLYPDGNALVAGNNNKRIQVEAIDGTIKDYLFHIYRPSNPVNVTNIHIYGSDGNEISYDFNENVNEYNLVVDPSCTAITFKPEMSKNAVIDTPVESLNLGFNVINIKLSTETDEKKYQFNILRKTSPLQLTSLIVEASDGQTKPFTNGEFHPDTNEYYVALTSDITKIKFIYTLSDPGDKIKEEYTTHIVNPGDNTFTLTVTDGESENQYVIHALRAANLEVIDDSKPKIIENHNPIITFTKKNYI